MKLNLVKVLLLIAVVEFGISYWYPTALVLAIACVLGAMLMFFIDKKNKDERLSNISPKDNVRNFVPKQPNTFSGDVEQRLKEKRLKDAEKKRDAKGRFVK